MLLCPQLLSFLRSYNQKLPLFASSASSFAALRWPAPVHPRSLSRREVEEPTNPLHPTSTGHIVAFQLEQCNGTGLPRVPRDPTQISRWRAVFMLAREGAGGQNESEGPADSRKLPQSCLAYISQGSRAIMSVRAVDQRWKITQT